MQESTNQKLDQVHFFLLINTKSGGGWGRCYLELEKHMFQFQYKKNKNIFVTLHDLIDEKNKKKALEKAVKLQAKQKTQVRIVICGGDGTIIWGIQQCLKFGLDFDKTIFCSLPIGTGNDFSRTIGWGSQPVKIKDNNILPLKRRVLQWLQAQQSTYDIWEVEIETYEDGNIIIVKEKEDFSTGRKNHKIGFVNYVGLGIDARVSYHFEKHRQSTKLMNLAVYACFGFLFCCKTINELSQSFKSFQTQDVDEDQTQVQTPSRMKEQVDLDDSMYEAFNNYSRPVKTSKINLKPGYHGLICLNSQSYMAGAMNSWETKNLACKEKNTQFKSQKINDGLIQFIAFKDQLRLGMEKMCHTGARVAQGRGPFCIQFKKTSEMSQNYIQIDGQGMKIQNIRWLKIQRHPLIPKGQIKIMKGPY